jgi:hypothetical protein
MRAPPLSAISGAMAAESDRPRFNLRLTPDLEALVIQSSRRHGRSKNAEIVSALEWRYGDNPALELAEALKPLLEKLTDEQRAQLVEIVKAMAAGGKRRR